MRTPHYLLLTCALLFTALSSFAQCSDWGKLITYKNVRIRDAARDRFGNLYVVGEFFATDFTIGPYKFPLPQDWMGAFVAKFDKDDNLTWAINPETPSRASVSEIEIDQNDNPVIAGYFDTSITFGCLTLQGSGRADVYVASLQRDGSTTWAIASTGVDDSVPVALTLSPNNNIILAAVFVERSDVTSGLPTPDISIGGIPVLTGSATQVDGGYDSFVASIRPDGGVAWAQGVGGDGNNYDYVEDVTTDSQDNVIITGYCNSPTLYLGNMSIQTDQVSENYFLAKINSDGEMQWVKKADGGINQSGLGIDTDSNDNIFIAGRFADGPAKFGSITLPFSGYSDIFVVKVDPSGNALAGRSFGNDGYDAGTRVRVNTQDEVFLSSYYYSTYIQVGSYSSTMPASTPGHSFLATLSNDLSTVQCAKFITGDLESIIWDFDIDIFDNPLVLIDRFFDVGSTNLDGQVVDDQEVFAFLAILGNNFTPDAEGPMADHVFPEFSIGKDTTLCPGQGLKLEVGLFCGATYKWSNGSIERSITVFDAGTYSVDVTLYGQTKRDEVLVSMHDPLVVSLGDDKVICAGAEASWQLPQINKASYLWSDGTRSNMNSVAQPGTYWVELTDRCETVRDEVTVAKATSPSINLGQDIVACAGEPIALSYAPTAGETVQWSDGSTESTLVVRNTGTYGLTVSNGCGESSDEIEVTIKGSDDLLIPNIVTSNGDGKNDTFLLPETIEGASVMICNRWGERVFSSNSYNNSWPAAEVSEGVYFYTVRNECRKEWKGTVRVTN